MTLQSSVRLVTIHTDGGSRGNPGPASAGVYVPEFKVRAGYYLGPSVTNNEAEYSALILALIKAEFNGWLDINIKADSELMVKQMQGRYLVKSEKIRPLHQQALLLASKLRTVVYTHVKRELNKEADAICNAVLDRVEAGKDEVVYSFVPKSPLPGGSNSLQHRLAS